MRNISKIAMAVAAALAGGAAYALPPATVYGPTDVRLVVSGSSAFQGSFKSELATMCSDTVDTYQVTGNAPNMQACTCTLNGNAGGGLNGKKAVVYYRAEGGSVWGPGPLAKVKSVKHIGHSRTDTTTATFGDGNCTGTSPTFNCTIGTYSLANDGAPSPAAPGSAVAGLSDDPVQLAISDLEPSQFIGENWVDNTDGALKLGAAPLATDLAHITTINAAVGQAFAIYVNNGVTGGVSTSISISKQSLTSIFSGLYTDFSQVPNAAGTAFLPAGAINVCLRDAGSGTQASASLFFNGQSCSSAPYTFVASPFARNGATGTELTCISGNAGGIGFATIQASIPTGTSIVNIDGVAPSRVNAANGTYGYWYEVAFSYNTNLTGSANENTLAQTLIGRMQASATVPATSPNVFALPIGTNSPVLPVDASHPVALGTRQGNSCQLPQGFN